MLKRILSAIIACILVVSFFTACSKKGETESTAAAKAETTAAEVTEAKNIKLKLFGYANTNWVNFEGYEFKTQNAGDVFSVIAEEFTKENPNVEIEAVAINAAGGGTQQLDTEIAAGNMPDVLEDNQMRASKYNGMGLIENIAAYITQEEKDDYLPGLLGNDVIWRLPLFVTPQCLVVNKSLFEKAGALDLLPKPDNREWTTDEFVKALKAVNKKNNAYSTMFWAKNQSGDATMFGFLWGFGAKFFEAGDYSKTVFNSPEAVEALNFMNGLVKDGLTAPAPVALTDDDMWAMWQDQKIAIAPGYPVLEKLAKEAKEPFEVYFVNYPHAAGKPNPAVTTFGEGVSVFKQTDKDKKDMAVKLAKYITGEKWAPALVNKGSAFSTRKSLSPKIQLTDEGKAVAGYMEKNGLMDFGANSPKYSDFRIKILNLMQQIYSGTKQPVDALKEFETEANKLLSE